MRLKSLISKIGSTLRSTARRLFQRKFKRRSAADSRKRLGKTSLKSLPHSSETKDRGAEPALLQPLLEGQNEGSSEIEVFEPQFLQRRRSRRTIAVASISPIQAVGEFSAVQLSAHTQKAYRRDLQDFFAYLRVQGLFEDWAEALTPVHIAAYRGYLSEEKGLAKPSVTRKLAVLKSFFRWARAREWIDFNPAELVRGFPQTQDSKTGFLVDGEIDQLLDYLDHLPRERLFYDLARVTLQTLLMLGLRRAEASRICLGDLAYQEDRWLLRVKGKGDRERLLPLPERLLNTWQEWLLRVGEDLPHATLTQSPALWMDYFSRRKEQPLLLSSRAKNFSTPLSDAEIGHIVRKFGRKAGLVQRLSPHMLRSTAITHALDQGASDRAVQQMAGWTSPLMITRYDKRRKDPRFSAVHFLKFAKRNQPNVTEA